MLSVQITAACFRCCTLLELMLLVAHLGPVVRRGMLQPCICCSLSCQQLGCAGILPVSSALKTAGCNHGCAGLASLNCRTMTCRLLNHTALTSTCTDANVGCCVPEFASGLFPSTVQLRQFWHFCVKHVHGSTQTPFTLNVTCCCVPAATCL